MGQFSEILSFLFVWNCCSWQLIIYNLYLCDLLSNLFFSIVCFGRSQMAFTYTVAKQLIIGHKCESGLMGLKLSVFSGGGMVVVSWLSSVDSLLTIWLPCFWFLLCQTASHIFGMGLRWWAFVTCNLELKHLYMFWFTSLVWCQVVLVVSTWLWYFWLNSLTFDNLPKILLGHFSLIHFRFLLTLTINF